MSTYTDFIQEPNSEKTVLFEISKGALFDPQLWIKDSPGVWKTTYTWETGDTFLATTYGKGWWGTGLWGKAALGVLDTKPKTALNVLTGIFVNNEFYNAVASAALVKTNLKSMFFDSINQVIYVNFPGYLRAQKISLSIQFGFSNRAMYFNDIYYEPRIKSLPNIKVQRDKFFDSIVRFTGGTITLINNDGEFDDFGDQDIYGQPATIRYGGDQITYDDYEQLYAGYLEKWKRVGNDIVITVKDERKNLQRKINNLFFDQTSAPNLDDRDVGRSIPIGYGKIFGGEAICINRAESPAPSTYNFIFVDTTNHDIQSIEQVYVEGLVVSHTNGDLTQGSFDLADTVYKPGNKVSVDFHGYVDGDLIDNPLDIIEDLLFIYADKVFDSETYNTVEWNDTKDSTDINVGLFIGKPITLVKAITDIAQSMFGTFLVEGDGRFNIKVVDLTALPIRTITYGELLQKTDPLDTSEEYISSAKVGYSKDWISGEHSFTIDINDEETLFDRFRSYKEQQIDTLLTDNVSSQSYGAKMMDLYGGIFAEYTILTKMKHSDLEIEDVIDVEVRKNNDDEITTVTASVIGKTLDLINNTVTLNIRQIVTAAEEDNGAIYGLGIYGLAIYGAS